MKMKYSYLLLIPFLAFLVACGGGSEEGGKGEKPSKEELVDKIKKMEDSLKYLQANMDAVKQVPNLTRIEFINRLLDYYHNYPEDDYAAECLDKVHMVYSGMNVHVRAVQYADTLLEKYPKYVNRALVLESQGSSYDIFMQPRDSAKVRYYYELLLKENPGMDKEKRMGIKERLKYNHLNFDQFVEMKMKSIAVK
jgi:hypothetical protein